jgi:hypothetical protein
MSKRLTIEHFEELCDGRNHVLVSFGDYTGVQSILTFKCNICGHEWTSTAASYKNSKTGCWGCKKKAISEMTKTRVFTLAGRQKISVTTKSRPAWNKGISGSVPGNPEASYRPTPEQRPLPGTLYLIRYLDEDGTHFKIGITRRSINDRFKPHQLISILHLHHATLGECFDLEQDCLRHCKQQGWRYASPTTTELIHPDGLPYLLDRLTVLSPP